MYELPEDETKADSWYKAMEDKDYQRKIDEIVEEFFSILNERGN